jgi:hypothetical protein
MSNSILSNDVKLKCLEVTDYLKIPTAAEGEFKKNLGREGEIKYNVTSNCLMVKTSKEWKSLPLKKVSTTSEPSAPDLPPPYILCNPETEKKMLVTVGKKCVSAVFLEVVDSLIYQQLNFLLEEAHRLKMKKITVTYNKDDKCLLPYLKSLNLSYSVADDGLIAITI